MDCSGRDCCGDAAGCAVHKTWWACGMWVTSGLVLMGHVCCVPSPEGGCKGRGAHSVRAVGCGGWGVGGMGAVWLPPRPISPSYHRFSGASATASLRNGGKAMVQIVHVPQMPTDTAHFERSDQRSWLCAIAHREYREGRVGERFGFQRQSRVASAEVGLQNVCVRGSSSD